MKFCPRDFSLDNAPRPGKPLEVDSDPIVTFTENNQPYSMGEGTDILQISKSIKLLVKMKNVSFILQKNYMDFLAHPTLVESQVQHI